MNQEVSEPASKPDVQQAARSTLGEAFMLIIEPLASLKLTVTLFSLAMFIVLAGTLVQVDKGIWQVMDEYFRTAVAWIEFKIFFPRSWDVPNFRFPFPGGWLIGGLLLVNLIAAHAVRFTMKARGSRRAIGMAVSIVGIVLTAMLIGELHFAVAALQDFYVELLLITIVTGILGVGFWYLFEKRCGIVMLHAALIILLMSEAVTGLYAVEGQMHIRTGESADYLIDIRTVELAVVDAAVSDHDSTVVVPRSLLAAAARSGQPIAHPDLPFIITVSRYMDNSSLHKLSDAPAGFSNPGDRQAAFEFFVSEQPVVSGVDPNQTVDLPSLYATLTDKSTGQSLGQWLFSTHLLPQPVPAGDRTYNVTLRMKRMYQPYTIKLNRFVHDVYLGTEKPKDYSSYVTLTDPSRGVERDVRVWMNHPLRYAGHTFFQSSFIPDPRGGPAIGTVLQVVENPGRIIPYLSCIMVAGGLIAHFMVGLSRFVQRRLES